MGRGAEAYLQMWERAEGVPGPGCRSTHARFTDRGLGEVRLGDKPQELLADAGQPERRFQTWKWCVDGRKNRKADELAVFSDGGKVELVASTARSHRGLGLTVGSDADRLDGRAEKVGGGLYAGKLGSSQIIYGTGGGEIDFIAVATNHVANSEHRLNTALNLAGLG